MKHLNKFKLKKTFALSVVTLLLSSIGYSVEYPVVSRTIEKCNKKEKCSSTNKILCSVEIITEEGKQYIQGWCISCSGRGLNDCPNSLVYNNGADIDPVDVAQGNLLMDYAIQQIEINKVMIGNYQIVVSVEGESQYRIYSVKWDYSASNEEEDSGTMVVERLN